MNLDIHLIRFDLSDKSFPEIVFNQTYNPHVGPLPQLQYPLIGLWTHENIVIKALFKATTVPTHENELIFHRYEGVKTTHQGQANYRYFTVPGYAGMVLSKQGFKNLGLSLAHISHHLNQEANFTEVESWFKAQPEDAVPRTVQFSLTDLTGNYPSIELCLKEPIAKDTPNGVNSTIAQPNKKEFASNV